MCVDVDDWVARDGMLMEKMAVVIEEDSPRVIEQYQWLGAFMF